jgi:hypothetical protein
VRVSWALSVETSGELKARHAIPKVISPQNQHGGTTRIRGRLSRLPSRDSAMVTHEHQRSRCRFALLPVVAALGCDDELHVDLPKDQVWTSAHVRHAARADDCNACRSGVHGLPEPMAWFSRLRTIR